MKFSLTYSALMALPLLCSAQVPSSGTNFIAPMAIELKLSANFGELRKNHFHSGLDFRTESRVGIPVYASEDGYLARIFVSPNGFGKALYLNHPNGYTTVYAHLDGFIPEIEKYVRGRQYAEESFYLNDFPNKNLFVFKKGDLVGYSGNSGSSGGPHLHFEIRDQQTEETLNPLGNGLLYMEDNVPPKIKNLLIYQQDTIKGVPIPSIFSEISPQMGRDTLTVPNQFFLGVECADYMPKSSNEYLIKQLKILLDSTLIYNFDLTKFAFSESRYINTVIDFEQFTAKKREIIRGYKDPNNQFSVLKNQNGPFIITTSDSQPHQVTAIVVDNNGNEVSQFFWIKGTAIKKSAASYLANRIPIYHDRTNIIDRPNAKITVPGSSLYQSQLIDYKEEVNGYGYSYAIYVGSSVQPLLKPFEIKIRAKIPEAVADRAFIARGTNTSYSSLGGNFEDGFISTSSSEYGRFFVDIDTIPPTIKLRSAIVKGKTPQDGILAFTITDDKTGIDSYDVYIDGKWVIGDYDPKSNLVTLKLDIERIGSGKEHELEFYAADGVGNTNNFKCSFYF